MSFIDLKKYKNDLQKTYKEVCNVESKINWVVYGYEGKSACLKVDASGEDGIQEMIEELSSSKIQYAYLRIQDPNSDLPKFVLINWHGEATPDNVKGLFANHQKDVANFLHGAHVTINARCEDDVDENTILSKVSKSSVSSFRRTNSKFEEDNTPLPVGTNYEKACPNKEIKVKDRNKFWEKQHEEEQAWKKNQTQKMHEESKKLEQERIEREAREAKEREKNISEKMKHNEAPQRKTSVAEEIRNLRIQSIDREDEIERASRSDKMKQERTEEAKRLISQRSIQDHKEEQSTFETQNEQRRQPIKIQRSEEQSVQKPEPEIIKSNTIESSNIQEVEEEKNYITETDDNDNEPNAFVNEEKSSSSGQNAKAIYDYEATEEGEISFAPDEIISDVSQDYDGWWTGTNRNGDRGIFPSNYVELI